MGYSQDVKHLTDKNECKYGKDGEGWRRLKQITDDLF